MQKLRLNILRQLALSSAIMTASLFSTTSFSALATITPTDKHPLTISSIYRQLASNHYASVTVDDTFASATLDTYLSRLDPNRVVFLQEDIDRFDMYRTTLDDALADADLTPAYTIYNLYLARQIERLENAITQLEQKQPFDFSRNETLNTDRSESSWPQDVTEANDLWRKQTKNSMLGLLSAGKSVDEARKQLLERYEAQIKRLEQTNSEDVFQAYANSITTQYDPHTNYFSPRSSENFNINMSLSLDGIGAVLKTTNSFTEVVRIIPASPAEKTGKLSPTDLIVGVGQGLTGEIEDVIGWRLDDVVDLIRGPRGSTVRLEIKSRNAQDQPSRIVEIERNQVKLDDQAANKRIIEVEHNGRTGRFGVIDIPAFYLDFDAARRGEQDYRSTTRDVDRLIRELESENIDAIVIDLRNNGGGSLTEAQNLTGLFIERGPVVQIRDQKGRISILADQNPYLAYAGPLAVLVNRSSASASEIFAGAMQDYGRALVVGSTTFGKGSVQSLTSLAHGQLKLTTAKYYRISGASTQHKGVIPDILFPTLYDPETFGESSADGALAWDEVKPAGYRNAVLKPLIDQIDIPHQARIKEDPDFKYVVSQRAYLDEIREQTNVPLNREQIKRQREQSEQRQLDIENLRRQEKGQSLLSSLDDLKDEPIEKDVNGNPLNPVEEAYLLETGRILMDALYPE